ncbi:MAG: MerR family transcriptional regulator [Gemmatimonadota bacterium]|nr:MAG: MerR family transcriptional regulator [Gemmatimonadota bacterium]
MEPGTLKVGELASRTGLTVRTLHHYDEIGLLAPSGRTPSGHRLYEMAEVLRLQKIRSLCHLGLTLDEIRDCLGHPSLSLERIFEMHLARLDEEISRRSRVRHRLEAALEGLRSNGSVSLDELLETIEVTTMFDKYYTPEQLRTLEERKDDVGQERMQQAQAEWMDVFAGYRAAMEEGLDPGSETVQVLARKAQSLILEFTGGDPGIAQSLKNMYQAEGPQNVLSGHAIDADAGLWGYMQRASQELRGPADSE